MMAYTVLLPGLGQFRFCETESRSSIENSVAPLALSVTVTLMWVGAAMLPPSGCAVRLILPSGEERLIGDGASAEPVDGLFGDDEDDY